MSGKYHIKSLQLYIKLRLHGLNRGGYVTNYNFSKSERYNILPKLLDLGLVKSDKGRYIKVVSHRKKCYNLNTHIYVEVNEDNLKDLKAFKAWIVSLAEKYSLQSNNKIQTGNLNRLDPKDGEWNRERLSRENESYHIEKFNNSIHIGCVSNEILGSLLKISKRSVTNWRSKAIEIHSKDTKRYTKNNPSRTRRSSYNALKSQLEVSGINNYKYITREMTPHEKVLVKSDELSGSNFFRNKNGRWYTKELVITSDIEVFTIGHSQGKVTEGSYNMRTTRKIKQKYLKKGVRSSQPSILDT